MAKLAVASTGKEVSIEIPAAGGGLKRRESSAAKLERRLNRFVRFVAFGEWAGNAFGALAFLWATGVVLGGFCTSLKPEDFWFATIMIFIEAFRIFSRGYRLDNHSLFGSTRALKWISSSFTRMLWRPQEGDEVVLVTGLWINLIDQLPTQAIHDTEVALLILLSRRPRRPGRLQIWALLTAYLAMVAYTLSRFISITKSETRFSIQLLAWHDAVLLADAVEFVAVLLLALRPRRIAILTGTRCGRILLSLAKVISALWLVSGLVIVMWPSLSAAANIDYNVGASFTAVVLSLGSLQTPATCGRLGLWIDAVLRICFLWATVFPLPDNFFYVLGPDPSPHLTAGLSFIIMLVLLLVGNLQIPLAVVQVVLSSLRFHQLLNRHDYSPLPEGSNEIMVPAIEVFYVLALCQGVLYIVASILGVFSFFPRRSLVRQSKLCGRRGAKAIDLYYQRAYATCTDTGLLAARKTMSLASFALESLRSSSKKGQLAGVLLLDRLLLSQEDKEEEKELKSRIISSNRVLSTLIGMLRWADVQDRDIRLFAARVTVKLAGSIRIAQIPGMVKFVSSLLDDVGNRPERQKTSLLNSGQVDSAADTGLIVNEESVVANNQRWGEEPSAQTTSGTGECSWVHQFWQRMKGRWSIPVEPPLTNQDSFPVLGMVILEKLACDLDNCVEMLKAKTLISKIIELIRSDDTLDNDEQQNALICSSLNLLRRFAATGENIGVALRQELWKNNFLLNNLIDILEDGRSSIEVLEPVVSIIAKLALNKRAGQEIGQMQVIIGRLLHVFLGRDGPPSMMYYDQSLRMTAGEALANIATWGTANCSAILAEPGYEVIKDLSTLLSEDSYRNIAGSLLQNICAHCRDKLCRHGASEHLSSALPVVIGNIVSASGKQLESLIGLASQVYGVIPGTFGRELDSHTNHAAVLVQKLVGTLNSNKKPNPEFPRMRRVIMETAISIVKSCPRYASIFKEEGMVEALTTVERTPSKVEKYRAFYGNIGVVPERGTSLTVLVAKVKELIDSAAPVTGAQQGDHA